MAVKVWQREHEADGHTETTGKKKSGVVADGHPAFLLLSFLLFHLGT